ncbi:antibiotic biosynthesis monooxygenase family protein [Taklimakanibacter deserti]|uniref:antibiotic biosynthesis monooxygenase family protein n=1 Tax=Taklimakanibacter deserti TaxID=2267839 RepID=UPI000E65E66E
MIARLWRTGLKPGREVAYETFAREISLPMFRVQDGFLGCVMSHRDDQALVLTFWRDAAALEALKHSPSYQATVERILAADLLAGEQSTEVSDVHLLALDQLNPGKSW